MHKLKTVIKIIKAEGFLWLFIYALTKLRDRKIDKNNKGHKFSFLAKTSDIVESDFSKLREAYKPKEIKGGYTINWVMSPPSATGGGHQNIYRFIKILEDAGNKCNIYLYASGHKITLEEVYENTSKNYHFIKGNINWIEDGMEQADAVIATGWETAYPVFNLEGNVKKFYFVQDFEPCFYPMGSEYKLAENTYRMGLHGLCAGPWLKHKLTTEYQMECDYYDFGFDPSTYKFDVDAKRDKVFFYARPVTPRRGFELGVLSLEIFHKEYPDVEIVLAGWDVSDYDLSFPHTNLKSVSIDKLSELYNSCIAGLVLSFSNVSLLPLELMSCGVVPVVNNGLNNEMVIVNENVIYCDANPRAIANSLAKVMEVSDKKMNAEKVAASVSEKSWDVSAKQFMEAFEKVMNG